jgi:hypothetical protein
MAVKTGGGLRTISWSITEEQYKIILEILRNRRRDYNRVSQSHIAREIVAAGLEVIYHRQNTVSKASDNSGRPAA